MNFSVPNSKKSEDEARAKLSLFGIETKVDTRTVIFKGEEIVHEIKKIYLPRKCTLLGIKMWAVVDFLVNYRNFNILIAE